MFLLNAMDVLKRLCRKPPPKPDPARVAEAVNLVTMKNAHVVMVGCGGARSLLEDLTRCGLGKATVIDPDKITATNVWSQACRCSEIDMDKVDALEAAVKDINPDSEFTGIKRDFLEMTEQEIVETFGSADLLLFMTDSFEAQARGNLVSLKLGKPAIFACVYTLGGVVEITFNFPGVTPACHRCITAGRYAAFSSDFQDKVGSAGSTIFSGHYLNAALGHLSLAMLQRGTPTRYSNLIDRIGHRNFVQLRIHPDFVVQTLDGPKDVFRKHLGESDKLFCFDAIWLPPDDPPKYACCPDCSSTGDLRDAKGRSRHTVPVHDNGQPMFEPKSSRSVGHGTPSFSLKQSAPPVLRIPEDVYKDIERAIGRKRAETGGMLIGDRKNPLDILHFHFDPSGAIGSAKYSPDYQALNEALKTIYEPRGMDMLGFVHSHPPGVRRPSGDWGRNDGDIAYARATLKTNPDLAAFLMPIAMTVPDTGRFELIPYVVFPENPNQAVEATIEIVRPVRLGMGR